MCVISDLCTCRTCPSPSSVLTSCSRCPSRPRLEFREVRGGRLYIFTEAILSADLREHAIFALSNLLLWNRKNQEVVDNIKPMGRWDQDGIMQEIGV